MKESDEAFEKEFPPSRKGSEEDWLDGRRKQGWDSALAYAKEPLPCGHPRACEHLVFHERPNSPPGNHMECSWCASLREVKGSGELYHEIVKRLRGAFIVAGLGEWTEWQAAIDALVKAAQAQSHFARLASERHDKILELERRLIDERILSLRMEREYHP